ncbi:hybrid sensor histidine kinase/response regulator [Pedobacter sp. BMA]|uniref:hybrid sensor histidine kinase/response regulator n=1 Tax=Pedobacter sp. BMA TaxID=1663685 RepID=UPI000649B511|nr:hybrid sensor histidine kinase/response regulator [Pedobacter sp. BMA]KLT64309.1 histidine kinase [Pedobacter sp. BMA]
MEKNKSLMPDSSFNYLIISAFLVAMGLLILVQYSSSRNMNTLIEGNKELLDELRTSNHLREIDRDILGVESRIRAAIATDDTTHLEGVESKIQAVSMYLDSLDDGSEEPAIKKYLERLAFLAQEKVNTKHHLMELYHKTGRMNDTTSIGNPQARITSDEITGTTHKIYNSRQQRMQALTRKINESGQKAKAYGIALIALLLLSGAALCWFITRQFRNRTLLINQLNDSERTSRQALGIKENFLANMSHEIRTPLNSILGFTTLLQRQDVTPQSQHYITSIQQAGENLLAIINDILDISKIEAGMMRIVNKPFSIRGLLHSVEVLFSERIKSKGLGYLTQIDDNVPDTLTGDATRLTQIMVNLLGNALKFSEKGLLKTAVSISSAGNNSITLKFRVSDEGIGIKAEKLERIFERFNQADDSITRNYGGTGLGLSIVKDLLEIQKGTIEVESSPGKGTTFSFEIPYLISDDTDEGEVVRYKVLEPEWIGRSIHILIVDDNMMNQDLMANILGYRGFSFAIASNGLEAIEQVKNGYFDLILMDIQMPEMDGYSATIYLRTELKSDIPIIAMTAHAMSGEREKCITLGMNDYISKPVNEQELLALIEKVTVIHTGDELFNEQFIYLDLTYMKDMGKGNVSYERKVTGHFVNRVPQDMISLQQALRAEDYGKIKQIAHSLRTTLAIMGLLERTVQVLDQLEFPENDRRHFEQLISALEMICRGAVKEAEGYLKSLK